MDVFIGVCQAACYRFVRESTCTAVSSLAFGYMGQLIINQISVGIESRSLRRGSLQCPVDPRGRGSWLPIRELGQHPTAVQRVVWSLCAESVCRWSALPRRYVGAPASALRRTWSTCRCCISARPSYPRIRAGWRSGSPWQPLRWSVPG
jgi:hypothetical protein